MECTVEEIKNLLFSLLNMIAQSPKEIALKAIKIMLWLLKNNPSIYDLFDPSPKILKQLQLPQLIIESGKSGDIVFDFMIYLTKKTPSLKYADFGTPNDKQDILICIEFKKIWKSLDLINSTIHLLEVKSGGKHVSLLIISNLENDCTISQRIIFVN